MSIRRIARRKAHNLYQHARFLLLRPPPPPVRFVVFGRGRSGSTLLVSLLNAHPEIQCDGEILHNRVAFPKQTVRACASSCTVPAYGFKLLSYQLVDVQRLADPKGFLAGLHEESFQIIYLKRDNLLNHALSNVVARRRTFHHRSSQGTPDRKPVRVSVDEVWQWMRSSESLAQFEADMLSGLPHLPLTYESHLSTPEAQQETLDRICKILGFDPVRAETPLVKLLSARLDDILENADEVRDSLLNTKYEVYLQ